MLVRCCRIFENRAYFSFLATVGNFWYGYEILYGKQELSAKMSVSRRTVVFELSAERNVHFRVP